MNALITGASSGIGRDIAKELNRRGYNLILVARDEKKLEEVKKELKTNVETVNMDISDINNCLKLYEKYKDIDILINNAGFGDCGDFSETKLEKDISMINTNIVAGVAEIEILGIKEDTDVEVILENKVLENAKARQEEFEQIIFKEQREIIKTNAGESIYLDLVDMMFDFFANAFVEK